MSTLYLFTFALSLTHLKCHSVFWQNVFIFYYYVHATGAIMGYNECNDAQSVGSTKSGAWCQMAITSATEISSALTEGMCLWGQPGLSHYRHSQTPWHCKNTTFQHILLQPNHPVPTSFLLQSRCNPTNHRVETFWATVAPIFEVQAPMIHTEQGSTSYILKHNKIFQDFFINNLTS